MTASLCLPARPTARPPKRVGLQAPREEQRGTAAPQPPRTMQDIVKGWWLFNNEIHASGGGIAAELSGEGWDTTSCIEIKPSGIASLKVSLNERPRADEKRTPFKPSLLARFLLLSRWILKKCSSLEKDSEPGLARSKCEEGG